MRHRDHLSTLAAALSAALSFAAGASAQDAPSTLEETYAYPYADEIYAETGIRLLRGDGHAVLADCIPGDRQQVVIAPAGAPDFCLDVKGGDWFLSLQVDGICRVHAADTDIRVTMQSAGQTRNRQVMAQQDEALGSCDDRAGNVPAQLLKLEAIY